MLHKYAGLPEWHRLGLQKGRKVPVIEFLIRQELADQFLERFEDQLGVTEEALVYAGFADLMGVPSRTFDDEGHWGFGPGIQQAGEDPEDGFVAYLLEVPYVRPRTRYIYPPMIASLNASVALSALANMGSEASLLCPEDTRQMMVAESSFALISSHRLQLWVSKQVGDHLAQAEERKFPDAERQIGQAYNRMWREKSSDPFEGEAESKKGYLYLCAPRFYGSIWCEEWRDGVESIAENGYLLQDCHIATCNQQLALLVGIASVWETISTEIERAEAMKPEFSKEELQGAMEAIAEGKVPEWMNAIEQQAYALGVIMEEDIELHERCNGRGWLPSTNPYADAQCSCPKSNGRVISEQGKANIKVAFPEYRIK